MATYGRGQTLGTGINPESFKQDFSGFTRAAEIQAQGMQNLGGNIAEGIEQYKVAKKERADTERLISNALSFGEAAVKVDPSIAEVISGPMSIMASPEASQNERRAAAENIRELVQMGTEASRHQEMMALKRASMASRGGGRGAGAEQQPFEIISQEEFENRRSRGISGDFLGTTENGMVIVGKQRFSAGSPESETEGPRPITATDEKIKEMVEQGFRVSKKSQNEDGTFNIEVTTPIGKDRESVFRRAKKAAEDGDISEAILLLNSLGERDFLGNPIGPSNVKERLGLDAGTTTRPSLGDILGD